MATIAEGVAAALHLFRAGDLAKAEAVCRGVLTAEPNQIDCLNLLAAVAHARGHSDAAIELAERALRVNRNSADAHANLALGHDRQGRLDQAVVHYRRALQLTPNNPGIQNNLGLVLSRQGKWDEAIAQWRRSLKLKPDQPVAHNLLGLGLVQRARFAEAIAHLEQAIALDPRFAEAHNTLGIALSRLDRLDAAIVAWRRAVALEPGYAATHNNLGSTLSRLGRMSEAVAALRRALEIEPRQAAMHSNLLMCLNYLAEETPDSLFAAHLAWGRLHAPAPAALGRGIARAADPDRRLRVAYLSPDFREQSVAFFVRPLLEAHDRRAVEIFCYSDVVTPDAVTRRLMPLAEHWVPIHGESDDAVIARLHADGIDILVDLAGHTANNRLPLFARKPVPVQINWLGYPHSTGLAAIDYRITDAVADPPGDADRFHSEALIRLPRCFLCYRAIDEAGPVAPPPLREAGYVTFGSFNTLPKMTPQVVALWARLLDHVAGSRLCLKAMGLNDPSAQAHVLASFAAAGVARERITLLPQAATLVAHLDLYRHVDIALDPIPYNGTTTTCEALWMGVPVVTLRGERHAGRVGASLLTAAGLPWLIAEDSDSYFATAADLARDGEGLAALRAGLRERIRQSSLCAADDFARAMEAAYRAAWQA
jgi:predicted O-linked N-acetylglucosamine transferase (SPINDLY family)